MTDEITAEEIVEIKVHDALQSQKAFECLNRIENLLLQSGSDRQFVLDVMQIIREWRNYE